jgi:serine/threonine protein kinase
LHILSFFFFTRKEIGKNNNNVNIVCDLRLDRVNINECTPADLEKSEYEDFELDCEIGRGGFGIIIGGIRRSDKLPVALKFFGYIDVEPDINSLYREIDHMYLLRHIPEVVRIIGVFNDTNSGLISSTFESKQFLRRYPVIAMERVEGEDLYHRLFKIRTKQTTTLEFEETVSVIFKNIVLALRAMHSVDVIHCDFKTENVVFVRPWEADLALHPSDKRRMDLKLIDFGAALHLRGREAHYVGSSDFGVSRPFLPPETILEQWRTGEAVYSQQTDVWQAGCVLFMMLHMSFPFGTSDDPGLFNNITSGKRVGVGGRQGPSLWAEDLLDGILCTDPAQRFTMEDILHHPWVTRRWTVDKFSSWPSNTTRRSTGTANTLYQPRPRASDSDDDFSEPVWSMVRVNSGTTTYVPVDLAALETDSAGGGVTSSQVISPNTVNTKRIVANTPPVGGAASSTAETRPRLFLSHDWGEAHLNHALVRRINDTLRSQGDVETWFDGDVLKAGTQMQDAMYKGLEACDVVVVFVTSNYLRKATGSDRRDNVFREFMYATWHRIDHIIPVVLDSDCKDPRTWPTMAGPVLGNTIYLDMTDVSLSGSDDVLREKCAELAEAAKNMMSLATHTTSSGSGNSSSSSSSSTGTGTGCRISAGNTFSKHNPRSFEQTIVMVLAAGGCSALVVAAAASYIGYSR